MKIYSPWAFTESEKEKAQVNRKIYDELKEKYRVYRHDLKISLRDGEDCNFSDYDVVIGRRPGYLHSVYKIHKNEPQLSELELALLCDLGNLCFGYSMQGEGICVNED